eukprot:gb/GEZN01006795.1/.p1 GENE.gb/GEZN01006795.1/~~gb/GEZN01006795.1/.p1  ORF type:complete len:439 (+),score=140.34 gb/GEZN01006795.1/:159-1319(+)
MSPLDSSARPVPSDMNEQLADAEEEEQEQPLRSAQEVKLASPGKDLQLDELAAADGGVSRLDLMDQDLLIGRKLSMQQQDQPEKWAVEGEGEAPGREEKRQANGADARSIEYNTDNSGGSPEGGHVRAKEGDCFMLHVTIIEAKALPLPQARAFFKPFIKASDSADPFLELELKDKQNKTEKPQRFKSLPIKQNLNPFFNKTYTFVLQRMRGVLVLSVRNHEAILHRGHLGCLSVDVASLDAERLREHTEGWYQLLGPDRRPNGAELYLCLTKDIDRSARSKGFKAMVEFERARARLIVNFSAAARRAAAKDSENQVAPRPEYPYFETEIASSHEGGDQQEEHYNYLESYEAEYGDLDRKDFEELQRLQMMFGDTDGRETSGDTAE